MKGEGWEKVGERTHKVAKDKLQAVCVIPSHSEHLPTVKSQLHAATRPTLQMLCSQAFRFQRAAQVIIL